MDALLANFPRPTLDRPFGIHLWSLFDKVWTPIVGYPADEFKFVPFETPMSTLKSTSTFIVIYYTIILGGRELMRTREPFKLKAIFLVHNFFLTFVSLSLLLLFTEQLIPTLARHGLYYAICDAGGGWTQPLVVLYYVRIPRSHRCLLRLVPLLTCLPTAQLPDQVRGASRHRLPLPQEEAPE